MKFRIEIIRDSAEPAEIVYRTTVNAMSPRWAQIKAAALLNRYASRGANKARVLNDKNEELFVL